MSNGKLAIQRRDAEDVLSAYDVGPVLFVRPHAGTANPAVVVVTRKGQYFLKRRNPRYSSRGQLTYDHEVIRRLAQAGLPVTVPVKTRSGSRWLSWYDAVYELYHLVEGREHSAGDLSQVRAAGALLGAFHRVTASLEPGDGKRRQRLHAPVAILKGLRWALEEAERVGSGTARDQVRGLMAAAEGLSVRLPDPEYWALPQCVIHGDYHPANLKFECDKVVGLFDFDWVSAGPRAVDLADGILFFCGERAAPTDPADIVSLTQAFRLNREWIAAFGAGYATEVSVEERELKALPELMRCRWLFCRVDAMERKVAPERKIGYLLEGMAGPLEQIGELADWLRSGEWLRGGAAG